MTQRRSHRKPLSDANAETGSSKVRSERTRTLREHLRSEFASLHNSGHHRSHHPSLTSLIERDAPLQSHSSLVLMYGPFQAEMMPQAGQGVASWLKECVHRHGIPSLVRFDYRHRAQIFRRDQFQPWLESLLAKVPS